MTTKPTFGISVDGSTRGNPGPSEYRGVNISTKEILFNVNIGISTNNIAEYLGLCHAIISCIEGRYTSKIIYSDSATALAWVRKKHTKSKMIPTKDNQYSLLLLRKASLKIRGYSMEHKMGDIIIEKKIIVRKWLTHIHGEIPADFGRK